MPAVEPTKHERAVASSAATERRKPRAVRNAAVRFARSVCSQRSSGSSQTGTSSARPLAGDRDADVERPGLLEQRVDLRLDRQVGPNGLAADLRGDRLGALASAAVVHDDLRALRRRTRARTRRRFRRSAPVTRTRLPARPVSTV